MSHPCMSKDLLGAPLPTTANQSSSPFDLEFTDGGAHFTMANAFFPRFAEGQGTDGAYKILEEMFDDE
ncbi:hypothetical protein N7468_010812 [Penicillium chermesinum]|uniref:Uncharacterized protein n=1 Tax=Penicillium chermesinum TaxID=63820 RepID=A0A9W9TA24_9EURO|nr:uncharacterized protein N7468_010812 [Penicillium chermesinum]KAJ5215133.1 hypothetical protein N7468_010812 [Penicillium chermesinum]